MPLPYTCRQVSFAGHRSQVTGHRSQVTGHRSQVAGHRSQVTGRRSQVAGHRSRVTGCRSHQIQKAISITGDVRITRDSEEICRYFHVTNVSPYNFNEKFQTSQYFKPMFLFEKEQKSDTVTVVNLKITFMGENWHFPWLVLGMPLFK